MACVARIVTQIFKYSNRSPERPELPPKTSHCQSPIEGRLNYALDAQHQDAAVVVRAFRQFKGLWRRLKSLLFCKTK